MSGSHSIKERNYYPINLDMKERRVLFLGGGKETLKEAHKLLEFGARVDIISQRPTREVEELATTHSHRVRLIKKSVDFLESVDLEEYCLAFAYSKFEESNEKLIRSCASKHGRPLVSASTLSSFFRAADFLPPLTLRRGHLKVSVSTDRVSPALEQVLINRIEAEIQSELDNYSLFLESAAEMLDGLPTPIKESKRLHLLNSLARYCAGDDIRSALRRNSFSEANQLLNAHIKQILEAEDAEAASL